MVLPEGAIDILPVSLASEAGQAPICLCACYAMPGTGMAYVVLKERMAPSAYGHGRQCMVLNSRMALPGAVPQNNNSVGTDAMHDDPVGGRNTSLPSYA
eukprot:3740241-Rhodomonas_salina.2